MRAVLDTNILISACWKPGGLEDQTIKLALAGSFRMCASSMVLAEYEEVLARPKFAKHGGRIQALMARLKPALTMVAVSTRATSALDEDDNRFLECAEAAGAAYLVTGNLKHFPAAFGMTQIVNARHFLITNKFPFVETS